jgi:hypothetical protein
MKKREREEVRKRWRQEEKHRKGEIEKAVKAELRLTVSPAWEFLNKQLEQVQPDEFNDKWGKAIIDLLRSDIPLDDGIRGLIATDLYYYYFPNPARDRRNRRQDQLESFIAQKQFLVERTGETPTKAVELIAKRWYLSVDALRQRIKRASRERKKSQNKIGTKI